MNDVHLSSLDLNLLVVLSELLRARSATMAARRLGKTQSAVSHALARLRSTFGDPLFVRVGGALVPTARAEEMAPRLEEVLAGARSLVASRDFEPARLERTFTLAATDYAEIVIMPRLIPRLRSEAPGVTVAARFLGDDLDRAVQAREVDLAYGTRFRQISGVVQQRVRSEEMMVLVREKHPILARRAFGVDAYCALDHVLVTPRGLPGGAADRALAEIGRSRRVVLLVPHFAAAALIVAQTDLVVTLPASFAQRMAETAPLRALPVPFPLPGFTFSVAYSAASRDDPSHRWFRARVIEAVRDG